MVDNNLNKVLKIGISGKRHISYHDTDIVRIAVEARIRNILKEHNTTEFAGYSGLAIGADTIFADIVKNVFKKPLHIILPFPVDQYKKDFTNEEDLAQLNGFLETNEHIEIINIAAPGSQDERSEGYFNAGKFLVDNCDEMIFVWDELKPAGKGGTAEVIGYYCEKRNVIPVSYIPVSSVTDDILNTEISEEYQFSNNNAIQSRNDYKLIWKLAIILGWLAVALFAANTAFHFSNLLNLISVSLEFILVITAFFVIIKAKKKDYHGQYLSHRLRAETLRIIKFFYHSNREVRLSAFTLSNDKELSALAEKLNRSVCDNPYRSKWYTNYSVKTLISEQMNYHENKVSSIGGKFHLLEQFNLAIAVFFMINLIVHLINSVLEFKYPTGDLILYSHELTVFLSILLPATYAACEGVIYFQEWAILKKYSSSARQSLHESINELPVTIGDIDENMCFDKQSVTLNLVSSIMLTDNENWHLILEDKNNYHWVI